MKVIFILFVLSWFYFCTYAGYEKNANQAKDAIMKIINDFVSINSKINNPFSVLFSMEILKNDDRSICYLNFNDMNTWYHQYHTDFFRNIYSNFSWFWRIIFSLKTNFVFFIFFQESLIKDEVSIDPRVHRMIVGKRGAGIRRIMSDYKVDIKMPREGAPDSDKVVVSFI